MFNPEGAIKLAFEPRLARFALEDAFPEMPYWDVQNIIERLTVAQDEADQKAREDMDDRKTEGHLTVYQVLRCLRRR